MVLSSITIIDDLIIISVVKAYMTSYFIILNQRIAYIIIISYFVISREDIVVE